MWNVLVEFLLEDNPHVIHHRLHPNKRFFYSRPSKSPNTTFTESMIRRKGLLGVHPELRDYLQHTSAGDIERGAVVQYTQSPGKVSSARVPAWAGHLPFLGEILVAT